MDSRQIELFFCDLYKIHSKEMPLDHMNTWIVWKLLHYESQVLMQKWDKA